MKFRHIPFLLLAVVSVLLATATLFPGGQLVYTSWWMISLWLLTATLSLAVIFRSRLYRRPVVFTLHIAMACILLGALVTHLFGTQGTVSLRMGQSENTFVNSDNGLVETLPFHLSLSDFRVENYPGTLSPMDFVSRVAISQHAANASSRQETNGDTLLISMNNIGEYSGYRFYQSGYDNDLQGTRLLVSHDPWGIGITYTGYALLFLSMLLLLVLPGEGFRRLLKTSPGSSSKASPAIPSKAVPLLILILSSVCSHSMATPSSLPSAPVLPDSLAQRFGDLYVYYNGRVCPMQTMARDITTKLYGKPSYRGLSAEQVLLGFMLNPSEWTEEPIIKVKAPVADLLGIGGRYACYQDFHGVNGYKLDIQNHEHREADEKMNILLMLFNGQLTKIYPYADSTGSVTWFSQGDKLPQDLTEEQFMFIRKSFDYIGELAWHHDYQELSSVLQRIRLYQEKQAPHALPSKAAFQAEKVYNSTDYTRPMAMLLMTLGIIVFFVYLYFWVGSRRVPRWLSITLNALLAATLAYLLFIICLRGYVSGHLPLSNGFETMQFMALATLLITTFMQQRFTMAMPFGLLLCGLTLLVAMMGEANPQITPLMPVLASPLLSLHVCIIMVAYSLLAFIMLNALTSIILSLHKRQQNSRAIDQLTHISHLMLYPAVCCLAAGIFIGAIWANQSWGRYWGWDPKETWALITLMVYAMPLHRQSLRWMNRPLAFHIYCFLAFLSILMTYFGVNYFLGGMHSYA